MKMQNQYRNNPFYSYSKSVNLRSLENLEKNKGECEKILEIIHEILHDNLDWAKVTFEEVDFVQLSGGITNLLLLVEKKGSSLASDKLVVRLFGLNTETFINRQMENIIFSNLSKLQFGPLFFGSFQNGRIEGFLPGFSLTPKQMTDEPNCTNIAHVIAAFHSFSFEEVKYLSSSTASEVDEIADWKSLDLGKSKNSHQWFWNKAALFFELSKTISFSSESQQIRYGSLQLPKMYDELLWYQQKTNEIHVELLSSLSASEISSQKKDRLLGRLFAMDEVLCHNDLLSGNVMLVKDNEKDEEKIRLIDYEYAAYNYRAFDIANHFSGIALVQLCMFVDLLVLEYTGLRFDFENLFPAHEKRTSFLQSYLSVSCPSSKFLNFSSFSIFIIFFS
jgi:choline kinase